MIKERESILSKTSVAWQTLLTVLCFFFAKWFTESFITLKDTPNASYIYVSLVIALLWYILLDVFGLGRIMRLKMYSTLFVEYGIALTIANVMLYAAIAILKYTDISRSVLLVFFITNLVVLYGYKILFYSLFRVYRRKGYNTRHALLIADDESDYIIDRLRSTADWGYKVFSIMTDSQKIIDKYGKDVKIIPYQDDIDSIIDGSTLDEVIYCKRDFNRTELLKFITACSEVGVIFHMQSQLLNFVKMKSKVSMYNQISFLTFRNTPDNYLALKAKGLFDKVFSTAVLILISPIMLGIAVLIKLEDGGPVFFKQTRVGLSGRLFGCLKFRTMVVNAEALKEKLMDQNEQEGPVFKMKNDPRITRIGRFLRKTSLDELPQFFNVLKGEMSVVGPRPPVPKEVEQYERWQIRRLSMKPGITCIWQVSGRNNIPFDQWMRLDLQYIDSWTIKLDLVILVRTVRTMLVGDGH